MCDECDREQRVYGDLKEEYHKPPPDDYDAIKTFRNDLTALERTLTSATAGEAL
jgi:hypothetical protein